MPHLVLAIDIGGTKTAIGLINPQTGQVKNYEKFATEKSSPDALLQQIFAAITPYLADASAIGIAAAGLTDPENGILIKAPNLPESFQNLQICQKIKDHTNLPTTIDNDAHCFTLAEAHFGQGKGKNLVFGITLGTGIGGGLTFHERLLTGANNATGEIGHISLTNSSNSTQCSCGKFGHLESYASGSAMTRLYKEATGETITAQELEKRALSGDKNAQSANEEAAIALAKGLSTVLHLINPDCIVLGGGLQRMNMYIEATKRNITKNLAFTDLIATPILNSSLGDHAQLIGAAMLTL